MVYVATSGALCFSADVQPRLCVASVLLLAFPERLKAGEQMQTVLLTAVGACSMLSFLSAQAVAKPARTCYPVPASSTRVFSMSSSTQARSVSKL